MNEQIVEQKEKMVKKTIRLPQDIAQFVDNQPEKTEFMRNAIERTIDRMSRPAQQEGTEAW